MQRFIDLGWHTVPLKGKLERLPDGTKTVPEFYKNWRTRFREEFNDKSVPLGGAITGECSNIIAIDCDNELTYNLFRSLDPEYKFVFESEGKGYPAGTIIYRYTPDLDDSFSVNDGIVALDFYSTNGFIYLPTSANKTKKPFELCDIKDIPDTVKLALQRMKPTKITVESTRNITVANCLQPLVEKFVTKKDFLPGLFRIITPKSFRSERQYVENGYLHPNNVPQGRGSEYMSKVSAIFGADPSIDEGLYAEVMYAINDMWDDPMDEDRLEKTVLDPMITGGASINGEPIWYYDENWKDYNLTIHTKRDNLLNLGYDDRRQMYYAIDTELQRVTAFGRDTELHMHISSVAIAPPKKPDMVRAMPLINVVSDPQKPFGFVTDAEDKSVKTLNTFCQTPALAVLSEPSAYAATYNYPQETMDYFKCLVPDEAARTWLLRFLKRKLTRFEYSPVILYFIGVHGSGKDTLVNLLQMIMGKVNRPSVQEFLEKYNSYMLDSYFVQLDEYGNQLSTYRDKEEALGKIKAYTGKQDIDIRTMRTDSYSYKHNVTFIMTANKNPLMLEDGDRRVALINTPNKMEEKFRDVPYIINKLEEQLLDFCYYLATEVDELSAHEYMKPFESKDKHRLIADTMYPAARITYVLKHRMYDYLADLAEDYSVPEIREDIEAGRITQQSMENLYDELTEYKGEMRALNKALKAEGLGPVRTTVDGKHSYIYKLRKDEVLFSESDD